MKFDFTDKRVLVTGGSRGIGRATVEAFLASGARVAVNGRTADSTANSIGAIGGGGDRVVAAPGDIATPSGCEAVVGNAVEALGGLDVLINSAGLFANRPIAACDEALWDSIIDTNVKGTFFASRAALPALQASGGNIVNLASTAGLNGYGGLSVYCASKAAVLNLTRAMAAEMAPVVRINCVCPAIIETDMARIGFAKEGEAAADFGELARNYPMKRLGKAAEVAASILYLASPEAGFLTGTAITLDGGRTLGT